MKKTLIGGLVLLITGLATIALAHNGYGPNWGNHMMGGGGYGHMWQSSNPADHDQMRSLMATYHTETLELRKQFFEKRALLNKEFAKPEKDQASIDLLKGELADISAKLESQRLEHMSQMQSFSNGRMAGFGPMMGFRGCF